jgi:alcohol dehydrogenase class IV
MREFGDVPDNSVALSSSEKAQRCPVVVERFIKHIGLRSFLLAEDVSSTNIQSIVDDTFRLPDFQSHPRIPTREDVLEILQQCVHN